MMVHMLLKVWVVAVRCRESHAIDRNLAVSLVSRLCKTATRSKDLVEVV